MKENQEEEALVSKYFDYYHSLENNNIILPDLILEPPEDFIIIRLNKQDPIYNYEYNVSDFLQKNFELKNSFFKSKKGKKELTKKIKHLLSN